VEPGLLYSTIIVSGVLLVLDNEQTYVGHPASVMEGQKGQSTWGDTSNILHLLEKEIISPPAGYCPCGTNCDAFLEKFWHIAVRNMFQLDMYIGY